MSSVYQPAPREEESHSRPLIIAVVLVALIVLGIWLYSRHAKPPAGAQVGEAPYAENLKVSDLHMSTARNFVGGEVTYIEGKIANTAGQTVTNVQVQCIFRNSLGEVVDSPVVRLQVSATTLAHTEFVPLSQVPLTPNKQVEFRLTFEHISADWNMGLPELRFVGITTR